MPSTPSAVNLSLTSGVPSARTVSPRTLSTMALRRAARRHDAVPAGGMELEPVLGDGRHAPAAAASACRRPPRARAACPTSRTGSAGRQAVEHHGRPRPPSARSCAGAAPLYGTCRICTPAGEIEELAGHVDAGAGAAGGDSSACPGCDSGERDQFLDRFRRHARVHEQHVRRRGRPAMTGAKSFSGSYGVASLRLGTIASGPEKPKSSV